MYNQASQVTLLQSILEKHPGGVLNLETNTITWNTDSSPASSLTYGGCDHLGFTVTKSVDKSRELTEQDVMSIARLLADEYWDESDAKDLSDAISKHSYKIERIDNRIFYQLPHEFYFEFHIEYDQANGHVTILWARNF